MKENKQFITGFIFGILIMSQVAAILGHAGYEIPQRYSITKIWSK